MKRRSLIVAAGSVSLLHAVGGCAGLGDGSPGWHSRLRDDTIALLGEIHDNPELHRLRARLMRRAVDAGWRPTLVMEQFDVDRDDDIERSRRERPHDVRYLIEQAASPQSRWSWNDYEPLIAMALEHDLPLRAGNLARGVAARIVRDGYGAAFGRREIEELGLDRPLDPSLLQRQQREIDAGHCGALPPAVLPSMARAQFARDAVMARVVRRHAGRGIVLLAGNGHVRRDLGVPRWLGSIASGRVLAIGFVEADRPIDRDAFDAIVVAAPPAREDPCEAFQRA
jgi:uncharacterized iron-regulated protein